MCYFIWVTQKERERETVFKIGNFTSLNQNISLWDRNIKTENNSIIFLLFNNFFRYRAIYLFIPSPINKSILFTLSLPPFASLYLPLVFLTKIDYYVFLLLHSPFSFLVSSYLIIDLPFRIIL